MDEQQLFWFRIVLIIGSLLLLILGYIIGNLSLDKSCNNNPLAYGIEVLNDLNDDNFSCTCYSSGSVNSFRFDSSGILEDKKIDYTYLFNKTN